MSDAWDQCAEEEAQALVRLLESDSRKVLVVVIASDRRAGMASLLRAVSNPTTGADGQAFVKCLDRERDRVASRLIGKQS